MLNKLVSSLNKYNIQNPQSYEYLDKSREVFAFSKWLPIIEIHNLFDSKIIDNLPIHSAYGLAFERIKDDNLSFFLDSLVKLEYFFQNLVFIKFSRCEINQKLLNTLGENLVNRKKAFVLDISDIGDRDLVNNFLLKIYQTSKKFSLKTAQQLTKEIDLLSSSEDLKIIVNVNLFDDLMLFFSDKEKKSFNSIRQQFSNNFLDYQLNDNFDLNKNLSSDQDYQKIGVDNFPLTKIINYDTDAVEVYQPLPNNFLQSSALEDFNVIAQLADGELSQNNFKNDITENILNVDNQKFIPQNQSDQDNSQINESKNDESGSYNQFIQINNFAYYQALQFFSKIPVTRLEIIRLSINQ
ncbi:hypothetical protein LBMAG18_06520 [Alphaproteobacteria bacterium]|nr:hypothetical protein LBMAG18_06520 [Alphaproteobacteria bacterium]